MAADSNAAEDWSVDDFLGGFTPVTRTVQVCMDAGVYAEIDRLAYELERASSEEGPSLRTGSRAVALAEQIAELRAKASDAFRDFVVEALGDEAWSTLKADHVPTKEQRESGVRFTAEFQVRAVAAACRTPKVSEKQARQLRERLSASQWAELWGAVVIANEGDARAPKVDLASAILRRSAPSSPTADPAGSLGASS